MFCSGGLVFLEKDFDKVDAAAHRMVDRAIALEGTCTGEHGVGIGKKVCSKDCDRRRIRLISAVVQVYLRKELGDGTVELMKQIKNMIDPKGIMNPGSKCDRRKASDKADYMPCRTISRLGDIEGHEDEKRR